MLVAANKQLYITLPKRQKMLLSRSIVNAVRSQNPPGRFLQKDNKTNLWFDVGDQRAQEKTSQALREGAPDIRKKVAAAKEGEGSAVSAGDSTNEGGKSASGNSQNSKSPLEASNSSQDGAASVSAEDDSHTASVKTSSTNPGIGSTDSIGVGMMPSAQFHPNSSDGSFNNPMQQQNMGMFADNNAFMLQMQIMYQTMMMNTANGSGDLGGNMGMTPQQQQMMQMMMAAGMANSGANLHMSPQVSATGLARATEMTLNMGQHNFQQQQHHRQHDQDTFEPLPVNHAQDVVGRQNNAPIPTFDEYVQAPESLEPAGLSYGSMSLTDAEMKRLQSVGRHSLGSSSGNGMHAHSTHLYHQNHQNGGHNLRQQQQQHLQQDGMEPAALDGLEPTGISFGDISMMSSGTNLMKLENTGTSFGTMMSIGTANMVDGGLIDAVGTSFGSLSLDPKNREALFRTLELTGGGGEIPPMFHSEEKAKGNLLDCSDTESESSTDKLKLTKQKSQAWEIMKAVTATKLKEQNSKGSVASHDLMPPPERAGQNASQQHMQAPNVPNNFVDSEVAIPTTVLESNFSTLSAWSAADDFDTDADAAAAALPPPQQLKKEDSW
jgi:hypothetical protein